MIGYEQYVAPPKEIHNVKYALIDNQKDEWVVFVHGIGENTKTRNRQISDFSQRYNLLLLDLPGHLILLKNANISAL